MRIVIIATALVMAQLLAGAQNAPKGDATPKKATPTPAPIVTKDLEAWNSEVQAAKNRINALSLFAGLTTLKGVRIPIPGALQRIPLEEFEGMEELAKNVELSLEAVEFHQIKFGRAKEVLWIDERPLLQSGLSFGRIIAHARAKTPLGPVPLTGTFTDGNLPTDLLIERQGYEVRVVPPYREEEGVAPKLNIESPVPLTGPLLTKLAGDGLGNAILQAAVGKTLKLDLGLLQRPAGSASLQQALPLLERLFE